MTRFPRWCATPLVMLVTGVVIFAVASLHYHGFAVVYGPDNENILAPLFFDISRSIGHYGLLSGMYDPGQFGGLSLWNSPWFHPLYPLYFNWFGTDATIFDTVARLRLVEYIHLSIYGAGCYLLCRELGIRPWLAVAIGLSSPWLPAVQSVMIWPQLIASFAWLPWIVACQIRLYKNPRGYLRILAVLGLAVSFSMLVYAQPAQNMVLAVVGSAIIWTYMAVATFRGRQSSEWRAFFSTSLCLAIAAVITLVLCGGYLYGVVGFHAKSIRWLGDDGILIGNQRIPLSALREYSLKLSDSAALLIYGDRYRVIIGNLYVGAIVFFCAVAGIVIRPRERSIGALFASAAIATLFCFYFFTPVLQWIPIANKVREVNWWSCYVVTILFPLGGYGLQQLLDLQCADASSANWKRVPVWSALAGFAVTLLLVAGSTAVPRLPNIFLLCVGFGVLLVCLLCPQSTRKFHQPASVMIILMCAYIPVTLNARPPLQQSMLRQPDRIEMRIAAKQIAAKMVDGGAYRFAVSPEITDYKTYTVTLSNLDLRGIRGDESPLEYDKFRLLFFPSSAVADLYGVKYVVVPSNRRAVDDVPIDDKVSLHINQHALPRLFFVQGGVKIVASPIDALQQIKDNNSWSFFVASKDLPEGADFAPYLRGDAAVHPADVSYSNAVDIKASLISHGNGLLVLNEDPAGRWWAIIDGKPAKPFRINGFQTAFTVTGAGRHTIEIQRPAYLL